MSNSVADWSDSFKFIKVAGEKEQKQQKKKPGAKNQNQTPMVMAANVELQRMIRTDAQRN